MEQQGNNFRNYKELAVPNIVFPLGPFADLHTLFRSFLSQLGSDTPTSPAPDPDKPGSAIGLTFHVSCGSTLPCHSTLLPADGHC
jgi:hypothetical protein